jgi:hypothetical protein
VQRRHYVRCNGNLDVAEFANDGLELIVVHPVERLDHLKVVVLLLVLVNRRLYWSEVLLVAQVDVVKQRTFARQEGASKL